ncbi:MAG: glutathione S-transferase family protein [Erythrobacter sp.]
MPEHHRLELLAHPGFGSAIIEAQLMLYGVPFMRVPVGDVLNDANAQSRVEQDNPLGQLPTLLVNGSLVMTESAAITLWLSEEYGTDGMDLAPRVDDPSRPVFLRWLIYWVTSPYPVFTYLDRSKKLVSDALAKAELENRLKQRLETLIGNLEHTARSPWFLGDQLTALDVYCAVFSEWTPGREWYSKHAPKLSAIADRVWNLPSLGPVYEQNFGGR